MIHKRKLLAKILLFIGVPIAAICMGECTSSGVCVSVGEERFKILPSQVEEFFQNVVLKKVNEDKSTNR